MNFTPKSQPNDLSLVHVDLQILSTPDHSNKVIPNQIEIEFDKTDFKMLSSLKDDGNFEI
jgi:hypothetical protein